MLQRTIMTLVKHLDRLDKLIFDKVTDRNVVSELRGHVSFIRDQIDAGEVRLKKARREILRLKKAYTELEQIHSRSEKAHTEEVVRLNSRHQKEIRNLEGQILAYRNRWQRGY